MFNVVKECPLTHAEWLLQITKLYIINQKSIFDNLIILSRYLSTTYYFFFKFVRILFCKFCQENLRKYLDLARISHWFGLWFLCMLHLHKFCISFPTGVHHKYFSLWLQLQNHLYHSTPAKFYKNQKDFLKK